MRLESGTLLFIPSRSTDSRQFKNIVLTSSMKNAFCPQQGLLNWLKLIQFQTKRYVLSCVSVMLYMIPHMNAAVLKKIFT